MLFRSINAMTEIFGEQREAAIALEISKRYERVMRGTLISLSEQLSERQIKGEAVIVVAGAEEKIIDEKIWRYELKQALNKTSLKTAVDEISTKHNLKRKQVYDEALKLKS